MTGVRLLGPPIALDRVAFVTEPTGHDVRVRFRTIVGAHAWRCDACGPAPFPPCWHAAVVSAAVVRELHEALTRAHRGRKDRSA